MKHPKALLVPALLLAAPSVLAQGSLDVPSSCASAAQELLSDPRPEPEWDVVGLYLASHDVGVLVRNDDASDPARLAQLRVFAKEAFGATVQDESGVALATGGTLGAMLSAGTLAGVEIDLFGEPFDPSYDPTPEPAVGSEAAARVQLVAAGSGAHVAWMYVYDAQQYAAREALLGAPRIPFWLGDLVQTSDGGSRSIDVSGHDNAFHGTLRAGGGVRVGGYDQTFRADVLWASSYVRSVGGTAVFEKEPEQRASTTLPAPPRSRAWLEAQPGALLFDGDVTVGLDAGGQLVVSDDQQSWPADGRVISTSGSIHVEGQALAGSVTLIATNDVVLASEASLLRPAAGGVLGWSCAGKLTVGGSANDLVGSLRAAGELAISGSGNAFTGQLRGMRFLATGAGNTITDGAH